MRWLIPLLILGLALTGCDSTGPPTGLSFSLDKADYYVGEPGGISGYVVNHGPGVASLLLCGNVSVEGRKLVGGWEVAYVHECPGVRERPLTLAPGDTLKLNYEVRPINAEKRALYREYRFRLDYGWSYEWGPSGLRSVHSGAFHVGDPRINPRG